MDNNNYLKELRLWLCASLKNSEAQLICENIKESSNLENELIEIINELQEITNKLALLLQELQKCKENEENNEKHKHKCECEKCINNEKDNNIGDMNEQ